MTVMAFKTKKELRLKSIKCILFFDANSIEGKEEDVSQVRDPSGRDCRNLYEVIAR